jgi:hypothetical protein
VLTRIRPWSSPGRVALAAMKAWGPLILVQGPVGSGKTGMFINKALVGTMRQQPWSDGVRRARLIILKSDYRRLWTNFIPSWFEWIPQHDPANGIVWVGGQGGPALQTIKIEAPGMKAWLEVHFMAIGDLTDAALEDFFAGLSPTWIWVNELHTVIERVMSLALQRAGRYPRAVEAIPQGPGVWGDFNAPIVDSWLFQIVTGPLVQAMVSYFRQPDALGPEAENTNNLPPDYYPNMVKFLRHKHEVDRKLRNKFGRRLDGEPVFDFDDDRYVADSPLEPNLNLKLLLAVDPKAYPSVIFGQVQGRQRRVLDEFQGEHGMGASRLGRQIKAMLDSSKYVRFQGRVQVECDPAARGGVDTKDGEQDWMARFSAEIGYPVRAARTNDFKPRKQAVEDCLTMEGTEPGMLISPTAVTTRQAMNGGYRWRRLQTVEADRYAGDPEKNRFADIADALQYFCMMEGGYERAVGRARAADSNAVAAMMAAQGLGASAERRTASGIILPNRSRGPQPPLIIP